MDDSQINESEVDLFADEEENAFRQMKDEEENLIPKSRDSLMSTMSRASIKTIEEL